jgi:hypothetical protein
LISCVDPFTRHFGTKGRIFVEYTESTLIDFEDFEDFQVYRRVLGVLGLCSVVDEPSQTTFQRELSKYPHALYTKLFSLERVEANPMQVSIQFVNKIAFAFPGLVTQFKSTPHSSPRGLDDNIPREVLHKLRARMPTRTNKLIGDLYLLVGAHGEAMGTY